MSDIAPRPHDKPAGPRICERCFDRPHDVGGHDALHTFEGVTPPSGTTLFRCAFCGSIWARAYAGGGQFDWLRAEIDRSSSHSHD